jgi:predicted nuclease of restriction endonuclease-like (RecB) superfamily
LELGTGFCFEARQKRITIGNEHDFIDWYFTIDSFAATYWWISRSGRSAIGTQGK